MKKRNILILIASAAQTVLWLVFLLMIVVEMFSFDSSGTEPLYNYLTAVIYRFLIIFAAAGLFCSLLMLLSLRFALTSAITENEASERAAVVASVITNILFYLSVILLFAVNKDWVIIFIIAWALCTVGSSIVLIVTGKKKGKERSFGRSSASADNINS